MKHARWILLSLLIAGCLHRSPEDRVLAAFREAGLANERVADPTAARCTSPTAHVIQISGDTAIVALSQDCATPAPPCPTQNCMSANTIRFQTDYLVVRRNGEWKVEKPISGGAIIAA